MSKRVRPKKKETDQLMRFGEKINQVEKNWKLKSVNNWSNGPRLKFCLSQSSHIFPVIQSQIWHIKTFTVKKGKCKGRIDGWIGRKFCWNREVREKCDLFKNGRDNCWINRPCSSYWMNVPKLYLDSKWAKNALLVPISLIFWRDFWLFKIERKKKINNSNKCIFSFFE